MELTGELIGFAFVLILIALVGLWSTRGSTDAGGDYLLAGQSVSPVLTAMSAAATKYSGYMFIGLIGYIYTFGLSAVWLAMGFLVGDITAFLFVFSSVRSATAETGAVTFAELVSKWHGGSYRVLRVAIGAVTLLFLATYAAAQFNAGGKALHVLFGWPYYTGAVIGASLILGYCLTGGLKASIWTDTVQSDVMMASMVMLLAAAIFNAGGLSAFLKPPQRLPLDILIWALHGLDRLRPQPCSLPAGFSTVSALPANHR